MRMAQRKSREKPSHTPHDSTLGGGQTRQASKRKRDLPQGGLAVRPAPSPVHRFLPLLKAQYWGSRGPYVRTPTVYLDRRHTWKEHWRLHHFRDYVARLERLGFHNIHVSWHRPNFESCLEIIPLNVPLALGYVFTRRPGNLVGQIKLATGRYLMKTHLLARLVPCLSVVACKRFPQS